MKIRILLIVCFIALTDVCFAQNFVAQDSVQTAGKNLENAKKTVIPSGRIIVADMKANHPAVFSQYQSGKKMQRTGMILSFAGGGVIIIGAICSIIPDTDSGTVTMGPYITETDGDNSALRKAGPVIMVAGAACLSVGLPVMLVGGKKKKQTFQDYRNQYYLSQQTSSYFQMNVYPNRVGIAYVF